MNGIGSLLDTEHYQIVEAVWAELERNFGVRGVYITPYPHFSYQVAKQYDVARLESILQDFAAHHDTFTVRAKGLAVFTGTKPVLYIPVVRAAALSAFQQDLWDATVATAEGLVDYYRPSCWVPHITIGFDDVDSDRLADIMRALGSREIDWNIRMDNVAFIHDANGKQALKSRFGLQAKSP